LLAALTIFTHLLPAAAEETTAQLISRCAPKVDADTMGALVRTESSGHVFVLSDSGPRSLPWRERKHLVRSFYPGSAQEAATIASELINQGHLVDIGLTQINSQNLAGLGVSVEQLFDPCTNIATGAKLLRALYDRALRSGRFRSADQALGAAVSAYNTGNFSDGFANGYVAKVLANMTSGAPRLWATRAPTRGQQAGSASSQRVTKTRGVDAALKARTASMEVEL
jgi:type IV secretion system protein VirB1